MPRAPMNQDAVARLTKNQEGAAAPPIADDHDPYNTADSWRMRKLSLEPTGRAAGTGTKAGTPRRRPKR